MYNHVSFFSTPGVQPDDRVHVNFLVRNVYCLRKKEKCRRLRVKGKFGLGMRPSGL